MRFDGRDFVQFLCGVSDVKGRGFSGALLLYGHPGLSYLQKGGRKGGKETSLGLSCCGGTLGCLVCKRRVEMWGV